MKKSILAGLILFTIFGSLASAQTPPATTAPLTLTGQVSLQAGNPFAVLKSGSDVWTLMVPHRAQADLPFKDGATVSVTGYESHPQWGVQNGVRFLVVSQVTMGNKEYILGNSGYGPGRGGWGPGMMGGRGDRDAGRGGCGW